MIRGSPVVGDREAGHAGSGDRLTPQPPDSAPAWAVTASSASQTSRAPVGVGDEAAQPVDRVGIGRGGGEPRTTRSGVAKAASRRWALGDGVGELRHGVALEAADPIDLDRPLVVRVAQADPRLAAVDTEHAHQPARRSVSDEKAAPDTFALSW